MFFFFMQIFLCNSLIFYRLFCMNHPKNTEKNSFWQSEIWANILVKSWQVEGIEWISSPEASILIEYRRIWIGMIGAFSLGLRDYQITESLLKVAERRAKDGGAIFWQREYDIGQKGEPKNSKKPYRHFLEPYTRIIDLMLSEDDILRGMHEKWRYNIRLAEKRGVSFYWTDIDESSLDIWMNLLSDTTNRDGFAHNSRAYYEAFLSQKDIVKLWFCTYEGRAIAAGVFVYYRDTAIYYYGASTSDPEYRKHMAPYLLQWKALQEAKNRGCTRYDFLGITWPGESESHLEGVTAFKEKFGWEIVELGPKYLIPLSWKYRLFSLIRRIKKSL